MSRVIQIRDVSLDHLVEARAKSERGQRETEFLCRAYRLITEVVGYFIGIWIGRSGGLFAFENRDPLRRRHAGTDRQN